MPFFGSLLARAARLWWYSSAEIPGVRSPGAIRCGCVSWSGCPNWHSAADTRVLIAGKVALLRDATRGLGRHACMLACRGRNRLLLMVVGIERAQGSAANHRNAQVRSPRIGRLSLRTAESQLALRSRTSSKVCTTATSCAFHNLLVFMCSRQLHTRRLCVTSLQAACHR